MILDWCHDSSSSSSAMLDGGAMLRALDHHASAHRLDEFLAQGALPRMVRPSDPTAWLRAQAQTTSRISLSSHDFPDNVVNAEARWVAL